MFALADFVLQQGYDGLGGGVLGVENDDFGQPLQEGVVGFVGEVGAVEVELGGAAGAGGLLVGYCAVLADTGGVLRVVAADLAAERVGGVARKKDDVARLQLAGLGFVV